MYSEKIIDTFPEELVAHLKGFVMKKVRVTDWDNPNTCIRYRLIGNGIIHIYELYAVCSE